MRTGQTLSHYQILEHLGAGGMGEVYKALDTRLKRTVAIKLLRADRVSDPERKQRFIQEAQSASALNHPNIVIVYDIDQQNGVDYMVMECVDGKTLDALIPKQGMRLADALKIAIQMAGALAKAHGAGIVHRDLKPANVMVSDDGHVKILDFGLAKLLDDERIAEDDRTRTARLETEEGTIMGTAAYMSPEQAEGRKLDARTDIFSFGGVLYEMVAGRRAFGGDSKLSTLSAILKDEPKPLEGVPADLDKIIRRCLRKDPARRFHHMDDLRVALEEVREDSESGRLTAPVIEKKRKGIPKWVWAAGLTTLALGAWGLRSTRPTLPVEPFRKTPLTTYAGAELSPTFSPDGRQIAFSWNGEKRDNFDIYVKMVEGGEPLRLTHDPAPDLGPAWSPDGRFIAFLRQGAVYLMSPLGGAERKVTDAGDYLAWAPDGKSIAFTEAPAPRSGGVTLLNLETGERRKVTNPPPGSGGDRFFAFSPDGRSLAFTRSPLASGSYELYVMPFPNGSAKRIEFPTSQNGLAWAPNGREILVASRGTGLWRAPVESGQPSRIAGLDDVAGTETGSVTTGMGSSAAGSPAVFAPSHRLAYTRLLVDENIWSLTGATKTQLIASTGRDFNAQFSPDESKIAFVSDRTGAWEIYVSDAQGGHPIQLTSFGNAITDSEHWSPDGRELVFAVLQNANRDLYAVSPEGGPVRRLTNEPSDEARPSYSMDGKWIYFRSNRSGEDDIWKMPRGGGAAIQLTRGGGFEAMETLDGKTLYFARIRNGNGLWSMPSAGGAAQAVPGLESAGFSRWAIAPDGVCYLEIPPPGSAGQRITRIVCWSSSTGKLSQMGLVDKPIYNAVPALSVSRNGKRFLWNQTDLQDADLVLVENFR